MKLNDQELPPLTNVAIDSNPQLYWTESLPTGFQLEGALYEKKFDVGSFFCTLVSQIWPFTSGSCSQQVSNLLLGKVVIVVEVLG